MCVRRVFAGRKRRSDGSWASRRRAELLKTNPRLNRGWTRCCRPHSCWTIGTAGRKTPCPDRAREGEQGKSHEVQTLGKTSPKVSEGLGKCLWLIQGLVAACVGLALCCPAALSESAAFNLHLGNTEGGKHVAALQ